ncbi:hypothetical protein CHL67_05895 [Prosthecochloris sp. GSB1]|nr:hypothetical protein CHL67_05895 [Prosthecochloris sp. GSB1]
MRRKATVRFSGRLKLDDFLHDLQKAARPAPLNEMVCRGIFFLLRLYNYGHMLIINKGSVR